MINECMDDGPEIPEVHEKVEINVTCSLLYSQLFKGKENIPLKEM